MRRENTHVWYTRTTFGETMNDRPTPEWIKRIIGEPAADPEAMRRNAQRVRESFATKLKRVVRRIPFAHELIAAYYCALDPATPVRVRATLLAALAYFVLPLDAIPDFLLGFGFTDDATVLLAAVSLVSSHITQAHRDAAQRALDDDVVIVDLDASDFDFEDVDPKGKNA